MESKKGSLALNIIVIAVIVLVVLIVIIAIFGVNIGKWRIGIGNTQQTGVSSVCSASGGVCRDSCNVGESDLKENNTVAKDAIDCGEGRACCKAS